MRTKPTDHMPDPWRPEITPEAARLALSRKEGAKALAARFMVRPDEACEIALERVRRATASAGLSADAADWERLAGFLLAGDHVRYDEFFEELARDATLGYRRYPGGRAAVPAPAALAFRDDGPLRQAEAEARNRRSGATGDPYLCLLYAESAARAVARRRMLLDRMRCREA